MTQTADETRAMLLQVLTDDLQSLGVSDILFNQEAETATLKLDDLVTLVDRTNGVKLNSTAHPGARPVAEIEAEARERFVDHLARVCHEVNRAYCNYLGDGSQPAWADAPDWQKESARNGVRHMLSNPTTTPEQNHESWLKEKLEQGWQYGPVKDVPNKQHPCCLPYRDLPREQRLKDYLFKAIINTLGEPS